MAGETSSQELSGEDLTAAGHPDPEAYLELLSDALERRASDLHIDPLLDGYQIRMRIDGMLTPICSYDRNSGERIINQYKTAGGIETGTVFTPRGVRRKFEINGRQIDCRITLAPCISGPKLTIRMLDPERVVHAIRDLGLDETGLNRIQRWLEELNGMFLVSGPTASGKTTTLYSLLYELASENHHVVTIEDPVEYEIDGINQIQVDRRHGLDFAEGVRTILRLDPDHAMVGELRDPKAAEAAVSAAIAGHVILATMHARDAVSSITALRNFDLEDFQISTALGVVVNQRLARKLCPDCPEETPLKQAECDWFSAHRIEPPSTGWKGTGCDSCSGLGYWGRTGLFEVWNLDEADYEMLLAGADEESIREKLERDGHQTVWHDAVAKIESGVTSFEEVRRIGLALPWD